MTDFIDTAQNYQPGIRIAPSRKWVMTNGTIQMDVCTVCVQPYREGHRNCSCPSNHPDPCERPTYDELLRVGQHDDFDPFTPAERFEHQRKVAGDNMNIAIKAMSQLTEAQEMLEVLLEAMVNGTDAIIANAAIKAEGLIETQKGVKLYE